MSSSLRLVHYVPSTAALLSLNMTPSPLDTSPTDSQISSKTVNHALSPPPTDPYPWLFRTSPFAETLKAILGALILALLAIPVGLQMVLCVSWDAVNRRIYNLLNRTVPTIFTTLSTFSSRHLRQFATRTSLVRHPQDAFFLPVLIWLALIIPAYFFHELFHSASLAHQGISISIPRLLLYNIIRLGPMYAAFMYVYVLCHKEAHRNGYLFERNSILPLRNIFNHWIGLFHGVLPGTFTVSHINNHHRYDNSARDVYTTAFRPRDSFWSYVRYVSEWFLYASNVSSCAALLSEGRRVDAAAAAAGSIAYIAFVIACAFIHLRFTLLALVYPFFEANILLSIVNFVWHAFIEEEKPTDDYINSTTIIEGLNFTLAEEYHVVHHQYAGVHWTKHKQLYERHQEQYTRYPPSAFYKVNIFELFYFIVTGQYQQLVKLYYRPLLQPGWSDEKLAELLKRRLQCHGLALANRVGRTYKGHLDEALKKSDAEQS